MWTIFWMFFIVTTTSSSTGREDLVPILSLPGEHSVLLLMDLQSSSSIVRTENNQKEHNINTDVNSEVIPVLLGALNMVGRLRDEANMSLGLKVYDSSGPRTGLLRLVAGFLSQQETTPSAVITMTSPKLTSALSAIMSPLGIRHFDISSDDAESDAASSNRLVFPLYSRKRAEATLTLLEVLNISYVSPRLANENRISQREITIFQELAQQSTAICSVASPSLGAPAVPVLFTGDYSGPSHQKLTEEISNPVVVIVGDGCRGDGRDEFVKNTSKTVLWIQERVKATEIEAMLLMNLTDEFFFMPPPVNSSLCTSFHVDGTQGGHNSSQPNSCSLNSRSVRTLQALSDAFAYIAFQTANDVINVSRSARNGSEEDSLSPFERFLQRGLLETKNRRRVFDIIAFKNGILVDNSADSEELYNMVAFPRFLRQWNVSNRCEVNCHLCNVCTPKGSSDRKVMLSSPAEESTLLIVGLFPVSRMKNGDVNNCRAEHSEGLEAARWFLNVLESYADIIPNVTVGGVALDTCGQRDLALSVIRDIETCRVSYEDPSGNDVVLQPSRVVAYVDFKNHFEQEMVDKILLRFDGGDFSLLGDFHRGSIQQMASILIALEWSYLKIVASEGYPHLSYLRQVLKAKVICIGEEVLIKGNNVSIAASKLQTHTAAVLFLTDHATSLRVLREVHSQNSTSRQRYIFMPWNSGVVNFIQSYPIEIAIITIHAMPESFKVPSSRDVPDPWLGSGEMFSNQTSPLALVSAAVWSLLAALEKAYHTLCPEGSGVCDAMKDLRSVRESLLDDTMMEFPLWADHQLDVFAVRQLGKVKIGRVDQQFKVQMTNNNVKADIPLSRCPGWCPQCFACSSSASVTTSNADIPPMSAVLTAAASLAGHVGLLRSLQPVVTIPGDIFITGVFPVHQGGKESFSCGEFVHSLEERQAEQAFLYAVASARKRYSYLLPGIQVGGILLDSCSSLANALHMLGQFESCGHDMDWAQSRREETFLSPVQVIGYVLQDSFNTASVVRDTVRGLSKMATISSMQGMDDSRKSLESPQRLTVDAILNMFTEFEWSHTHILTSEDEEFMDMAEYFVDEAGYRGVCVVNYLQMIPGRSNVRKLAEVLSDASSTFVPLILFLTRADAVTVFRDREVSGVTRPWIISTIGDDWLSTVGINIPLGSLIIDIEGKVNDDFQVFLEQFSTFTQTPLSSWWQDYLHLRFSCRTSHSDSPERTSQEKLCEENPLLEGPMHPSAQASRVIRSVDSLLHALDARYKTRCPESHGICSSLSSDIAERRLRLADASFMYEEGLVSFQEEDYVEVTLSVMSYQPGKLVKAGTYRSTGLAINASLVQFFTSRGQPLPQSHPLTLCPGCMCINIVTNMTQSPTFSVPLTPALAKWLWHEQRGVFIREIWAWTVLAVAVGGAFITLFFIFYVMFKVWQGALARRYIGLGLLLLVSIVLLYMSTLPFLFSPSVLVCGLRYLLPSLALCLCFACILVKLMALQEYRNIGLGGELSGLNQGLSVFFLLLVQISISVQWWIFNDPFLQETLDTQADVIKYSCLFRPRDFVLTLCFVFFLVFLCAIYSVSVRREKKNMGEAKLLLAGSWVVLILWLGWVPLLLFFRDRDVSVVSCGGILATASTLLLVVYVPKVRMVARLKYDISSKHAVRNGYSVDTDFLYERPYSLPGTLTSTYSSIRTYPKSVAATNFDSSLSY